MSAASPARRVSWGLAVLLGAGLAVRLWGITFGLPHVRTRPDELLGFGVVLRLQQGNPNPNMFDYPSFYLYFVAGLFSLYYIWGLVTGRFSSVPDFIEAFRNQWEPFYLMTRTVTAIFGTATIAVCHGIAAPLFGNVAAGVSAFFLAFAFLHVRDSHYATNDVPMTFFITAAVFYGMRVYSHRRARDAWIAGVFAGLATGTKYNAAPVVVPLAIIELVHAWKLRGEWRRVLRENHLWRMALASAAIFVVTSPYLFLDYENARRQLTTLASQASAGMTPPEMLGSGWTYHLPFSLRYGLGIPLLSASLAGMVWMTVRQRRLALILASFPISYYLLAGVGYNVFVRYMIPIVPFLCIFAGYFVTEAAALITRQRPARRMLVTATAAVVLAAPSIMSVVRFDWLMMQEDSRVMAARWVHENVPERSTLYMSGNRYGHLQLERGPVARFRYLTYDWEGNFFAERGRRVETPPDWIVVQRSAIPYSHVLPGIAKLLESEYRLVYTLRAANLSAPGVVYDIQDGFYAPYGGFDGVRRPGPNVEIYQRREDATERLAPNPIGR